MTELIERIVLILLLVVFFIIYIRRMSILKKDGIIFEIKQPKWYKIILILVLVMAGILIFLDQDTSPVFLLFLVPVFFTTTLVITNKGIFTGGHYIRYNQIKHVDIKRYSTKRFRIDMKFLNKKGKKRELTITYENKYKDEITNILGKQFQI